MNRLLLFHVATSRNLVLGLTLIPTNAVQVIGESTGPDWVEVIDGDTRLLQWSRPGRGGLRDAPDVSGQPGACTFGTSTKRTLRMGPGRGCMAI